MLSFGGFLNSTFWSSYRNQASTSIEELLANKECTVEKLLEDEDCLQEFKNLNDKLIQYFDHEKMKSLVDLITVMPSEDATHNRGHKLPFLANEIFNCEINALLDKFFDAPERSAKKVEEEAKAEEPAESKEDEQVVMHSEEKEDEAAEKPASPSDEAAKPEEEEGKAPEESSDVVLVEPAVTSLEEPDGETIVEEVKQLEEPIEVTQPESTTDTPVEEVKATPDTPMAEPVPTDLPVEKPHDVAEDVEMKDETSKQEEIDQKTDMLEESKVSTQALTEPEAEDSIAPEEQGGKFMLLERLLKFIRSRDKPLNAVLAGYFSKLMTLLINRRQKSLVPFVFAPECDVIESLLYHVYQKSLSELVNKFLNVPDESLRGSWVDETLAAQIKERQHFILNTLIDKLGPNASEEDNLNASGILQEALENKEFFAVVSRRNNVLKMVDFALPLESHVDSQNAALGVLTALVAQYLDRTKDKRKQGSEDEDSTQVEEDHTDDFLEVLAESLPNVVRFLQIQNTPRELETSYEARIAPMGSLRLKLIEFVHHLLKLQKDVISIAIGRSGFFGAVTHLLEAYPWNNFLHLKAIALYEELFESSNTEARHLAIQSSGIGQALLSLGGQTNFGHISGRPIRHGHMAVVVKLSNLIVKNKALPEVAEHLGQLGEEWQKFVEGELKRSNDANQKALGGHQPRTFSNDDDDMEGSMSMDSILSRFSNFSTERSKRENANDDDEEDEDEEEEEGSHEGKQSHEVEQDEDRLSFLKERDEEYNHEDAKKEASKAIIPVHIKEEPLVEEFLDTNYWKVDLLPADSIDDLMAELAL